jgi:hypothetical protein
MNFSDFNSVICQEVMPFELKVTAAGEKSENLSVIVEELFLRFNTTMTDKFSDFSPAAVTFNSNGITSWQMTLLKSEKFISLMMVGTHSLYT